MHAQMILCGAEGAGSTQGQGQGHKKESLEERGAVPRAALGGRLEPAGVCSVSRRAELH